MTSEVKVNAHAGFPVKVTQVDNGGTPQEVLTEVVVAPNTVGTFNVWAGHDLVIHEVQPESKIPSAFSMAPAHGGYSTVAASNRSNRTDLTFGERAVGLSFNPSSNGDVDKLKRLYADIIDHIDDFRKGYLARGDNPDMVRRCGIAITEAQTAQMWAVKAVTWR